MDSLEFNKIAGGLLVGLLLAVGIGKLGSILYAPYLPEHAAVETVADAHSDTDVGGDGATEQAAVPFGMLLASADPADGEGLFRRCATCHTIESGGGNKVGPNLYGIIGASAEHSADFGNYSGAISSVVDSWSFENMNAFLENPRGYAPGTSMGFAGLPDAEDRANLIAWLNTRSDAPVDLPAVEEMPAEDDAEAMGDEAMSDEAMAADTMTAEKLAAQDAEVHGDTVDGTIDATGEVMDQATNAAGDMVDEAAGGSAAMTAVAAASAQDGRGVARKCSSCHTFDEGGANRVGPNLWGIMNQDIGSVEGYSYSDAMASEPGTWTVDRMWSYIMDPKGDIPGTRMGFRGIADEEDLAALIAYLSTLK
ncbi:MAG: c-type cytochrome [Rhodospirillales bacterium]|nr:c-type cytochrome [Rhodospirillales bacterium]